MTTSILSYESNFRHGEPSLALILQFTMERVGKQGSKSVKFDQNRRKVQIVKKYNQMMNDRNIK